MKLTNKQELFIQYYMISLNATSAYKKAGYGVKSDKVACINALRLLGNARIKKEIQDRLAKRSQDNGITADYVLQGIKAIADKGERDNDRLKAYELLGKNLKLFTEKIESTIDATIEAKVDLTGYTTEQLKEMLKD